MRRVGLRALLAGMMSIGLASTAVAGTLDRTDLLDIDNSLLTDKLDSPLTRNRAFLFMSESSNSGVQEASGSVFNSASGGTFVFWRAFEPDQVKRTATGGSLQQKNQLGIQIVLKGVQLVPFQVVEGCKAKVEVKAPKGAVTSGDINKGNWSVNCSGKKATTTPPLTDQNLTDLQAALGKKVVGKNNFNIKGKCTDANCND